MKSFFGKAWSSIKNVTGRVWTYAKKHKIIAGVVVIIIIGGGYWAYSAIAGGNSGLEYVLTPAVRGPLQVTVTGSGQVAANDQLDLAPQASGQVTEVDVTTGESVKAGTVVARIDSTTADEALASAQSDLESAQISYQQALSSSNTSISSDQTSVNTDLGTTYSDIPTVMNGLNSVLYTLSTVTGYTAEDDVDAYADYIDTTTSRADREEVIQAYATAQAQVATVQAAYTVATTENMTPAQLEQLAQQTQTTLSDISAAVNDTLLYYNYINSQVQGAHIVAPSQLASQISSLNGYASTVNGDATSLTNALNTYESDTQTLAQSDSSEPLSVQTAQLNLQKAQEEVDQAEQTESNYVVVAPFDGVIADVDVKPFDQASSGTTVATLITTEEYADLSLNEADVAKVQVGQPAVMTFDALPNITMDGTVASVSDVGTVTSGVVTYDVKIGFSSVNTQIKPGMTVDATIITNSVANAIQVPAAAIQTVGNNSFVQVATLNSGSSTPTTASSTGTHHFRTGSSTGAYAGYGGGSGSYGGFGTNLGSSTSSTTISLTTTPTARSLTEPASAVTIKDVPVVVGLTNDTETQIVSGLTAGQLVVTATQTAANSTTKSSAASATSLLGGTRSAGAALGGSATFRTGGGGFSGGGGGATGGTGSAGRGG